MMRNTSDAIRRLWADRHGANAVEFALVAPMVILLLFGIIGFGYVFGVYHSVQQIAAEAARASVAGVSDPERDTLARDFVSASLGSYLLLDPAKLRVTTAQSGPPHQTFEVAIRYDMSDTLLASLSALVALPPPLVERRAVVQRGGY
jgi:Flp pilus assembly protein TadG